MLSEHNKSLFKDIAIRFAEESHCLSKKVAALAIKDDRIIGSGINGTPKGWVNCDEYWRTWHSLHITDYSFEDWIKTSEWKVLHHDWSNQHEQHAEANLIADCVKRGVSLNGADIIVTLEPCVYCAKLILGTGVKNVYYCEEYDKSSDSTNNMIIKSGLNLIKI